MKKFEIIFYALLLDLVAYLCVAFAAANFNFTAWDGSLRGLLAFIFGAITALGVVAQVLKNDEDRY